MARAEALPLHRRGITLEHKTMADFELPNGIAQAESAKGEDFHSMLTAGEICGTGKGDAERLAMRPQEQALM